MNLHTAIYKRRSVRRFLDKPVEQELYPLIAEYPKEVAMSEITRFANEHIIPYMVKYNMRG